MLSAKEQRIGTAPTGSSVAVVGNEPGFGPTPGHLAGDPNKASGDAPDRTHSSDAPAQPPFASIMLPAGPARALCV